MKPVLFSISLYLSLAIFVLGILWRVRGWLTRPTGGEDSTAGARGRAVCRGLSRALFSARIVELGKTLWWDVLLLRRSWRQGRLRWAMHMCIFYGFMGLLLMHALGGLIMEPLFEDYQPTVNPYLFLRDLFGLMVLVGVGIAVYRRRRGLLKDLGAGRDWFAVVLLAVIMVSGFALQAAKIVSPGRYQEMVEEYAGLEDEQEEAALKAYWAQNYGVVFPGRKDPFSQEMLEQGAELNEDNCAECHSRPQAAFVSYPLSRLLAPATAWLESVNLRGLLWQLHFLACFLGLAYLPFSKFLHVLVTPLTLLINGLAGRSELDPAAAGLRRAIDLDGCTHCGACSEHCSVAAVFRRLRNRAILPSEKLWTSRAFMDLGSLSDRELLELREGSYICTSCNRCSEICPSGLDLQHIWFAVKDELARRGYASTYEWARFVSIGGKDAPRDGRGGKVSWLAPRPRPLPGGTLEITAPEQRGQAALEQGRYQYCFQCQTCTNVCPVVACLDDAQDELGLLPHQIMHCLGLGLMDQAQAAAMTWDCATCYQCQEHCPQKVPVADLLFALRNRAFAGLDDRRAQG